MHSPDAQPPLTRPFDPATEPDHVTSGHGNGNGHSNGHSNGNGNGDSNGNGHSNGNSNGHSNGNGNGHSNGNGNGSTTKRRVGRPPKVDELGRPTRERLLVAGAQSLIDHGFDATRLADVARAADVSTPAIYNHFADKNDFLVAVTKWSLTQVGGTSARSPYDPRGAVRRYLADEFAEHRRLLTELHLASFRHPGVADLLKHWHTERATAAAESGALPLAQTKALYLLLLGLCQADAVADLGVSRDELVAQLDLMVAALVPADSP